MAEEPVLVNIKAQGLLNATKWIEERYGQRALQDVIRACSPEVRERYVSAIAINWHSIDEYVELLTVAERILGVSDGRVCEEIGAASARANMRSAYVRFAVYVSKPEFMMRRIAGLWRQFNDEGTMVIHPFVGPKLDVEIRGIPTPNVFFCATITGWAREIAKSMGLAHTTARHVECRARGGARCVWHVRGSQLAEPPR